MNQTFTLPENLIEEIDILKNDLGFGDVEATIQYLLQNALASERKVLVARLYHNRQKTMRQCAEMLKIDLEQMTEILQELEIPFHDDLEQQLQTVNELANGFRPAAA